MNITNDEEAISFFNRLLGSLHQADYSFKGSIQLVYVAKGAQHVGNIRTQNVYTNKRQESMPPRRHSGQDTWMPTTSRRYLLPSLPCWPLRWQ